MELVSIHPKHHDVQNLIFQMRFAKPRNSLGLLILNKMDWFKFDRVILYMVGMLDKG